MKKIMPFTYMTKGKETLPNITSPAMMDEYEVIDELPDDTSPVVTEDCVNDEHKYSITNYFIE